jgi:2-dehydropantoate 2-reductase
MIVINVLTVCPPSHSFIEFDLLTCYNGGIMRTIIYGAGGIGSVVGGHLARTGHEVVFIGRAGHVNAINERGLQLITPNGTFILRLPAVTIPDQIKFRPDDVVFLTMKSQNTENALKDLQKVTKDVPIFCMQNGVRNEETAAKHFSRVYGVSIRLGAGFLKNGEVIARRDPAGWLVMGRYPRGNDELLEAVAKTLRAAGLLVMVTSDVMPYKWGKLMSNLSNAACAITDAKREDVEFINRAARQELHDLLLEAGIRCILDAQLAEEWPEFVIDLGSKGQSSTWQSLARKQGTVETEYFNGEVIRLAKKLGKQAPVNEGLMRICQEMAANHETPGKYTPEQLGKMLRL